jgi:hypothetical protein
VKWWHIALPVGIVGAIVATTRDDKGGPYPVTDFPKPLYVGERGDPELEALLTELSDYLSAEGVDVNVASAAEITKMRKTPGPSYAIPSRALWPSIAHTLKQGFMVLRWALGQPITIWNGYRPPDYNAAVGGSEGSRHQEFALDLSGQTPEATRELAEYAASLYRKKGAELKMGLGVYGYPTPTRIHIDLGWKQRTWGDASTFVQQAAAKA